MSITPSNILPLIPLVDKVLLPSIVTKLSITSTEAAVITRHLERHGGSSVYIVCVPVHTPAERTALLHANMSNIPKVDGERRSSGASSRHSQAVEEPCLVEQTKAPSVDLQHLFHFGCVAQITRVDKSLPGTVVLHVRGVCRSRIDDIYSDGAHLEAKLVHFFEPSQEKEESELGTLPDTLRAIGRAYIALMRTIGVADAVLRKLAAMIDTAPIFSVVDLLLCIAETSISDKLQALEITDAKQRLELSIELITRHLQTLEAFRRAQEEAEEQLDKKRRDFYLRQFNVLHNADSTVNGNCFTETTTVLAPKQTTKSTSFISPTADDDEELIQLVNSLNQAQLPAQVASSVTANVNRLRKLSPSSPDAGVLRTYLQVVAEMPWQVTTPTEIHIALARKQLDADHYGMEPVKRRILEYLSVVKIKQDMSPPILCLHGPPGVGKTTLAKSIAQALKRKFHRAALGGIRDEADIRGHRRTYVGAMPGLLVNGLRRCGVKNPVFLLDEIDKMAHQNQQGDPSAAMLEVLDPAQNSSFQDHYLDLPFDLSGVLFIATANSLDTIPPPLLDRMEVITIGGYTSDEKLSIARSHLVPKQMEAHGLKQNQLVISNDVLLDLAENYTRESGVRQLDRCIASICRSKCHEYAQLLEAGDADLYHPVVDNQEVRRILGIAPFESELVSEEETAPGVVNGLAYAQSGSGGILPIESSTMPGRGQIKLTGSLGDVIKESAHIAVSWIKANGYTLKLAPTAKHDLFHDIDVHIHLPSGAVPKDGPSAGVSILTSLVSLLSGQPVRRTTAMTGEITLRGQVRPVGGIREKVLAARRAGITRILLPVGNKKDVTQDVSPSIQCALEFVYCKTVWDVIAAAFLQDTNVIQQCAGYSSRL